MQKVENTKFYGTELFNYFTFKDPYWYRAFADFHVRAGRWVGGCFDHLPSQITISKKFQNFSVFSKKKYKKL